MAGPRGFEPLLAVLETVVLPLNTKDLSKWRNAEYSKLTPCRANPFPADDGALTVLRSKMVRITGFEPAETTFSPLYVYQLRHMRMVPLVGVEPTFPESESGGYTNSRTRANF